MNHDPEPQIPIIKSTFPERISLKQDVLKRSILHSPENTAANCRKFVIVMQSSIHELYYKHKGPSWAEDKIVEMQEEGLIYVYYCSSNGEVVAFMSFVLTYEEGLVLYLYEIQVLPEWHENGLGKSLIDSFHDLVRNYRKELKVEGLDISKLEGTKLTVFSDNKVLNWYKKLGYELAEESPRDKSLRNGKVLKPDYYIMFKEL